MQGLIVVTWEQYLSERFGRQFLEIYRQAIGERLADIPLASRIYDDERWLIGVEAASKLTKMTTDTLLREFGRYFLLNGLTRHFCAYLLDQVRSGRALVLAMRDAHAQMRRASEQLIPPIFRYEAISTNPNELALIYDSPRQLCSLLWGAIEGAAERYGERVSIVESRCMKQGAPECCLELHFFPGKGQPAETTEQTTQRLARLRLAHLVLLALPEQDGVTLAELASRLRLRQVSSQQARPSMLLEALQHLQHAGLVNSSAGQPGDELYRRRYWRAPTSGK
jgi:predicted hydrocarbon binding protein